MSFKGHRSGKGSPARPERKRQQSPSVPASHRRVKSGHWTTFAIGVCITTAAFVVISQTRPAQQPIAAQAVVPLAAQFPPAPDTPPRPATLNDLLSLSLADLEKVDLAAVNLRCAEGLPGSENLNVAHAVATLDR